MSGLIGSETHHAIDEYILGDPNVSDRVNRVGEILP